MRRFARLAALAAAVALPASGCGWATIESGEPAATPSPTPTLTPFVLPSTTTPTAEESTPTPEPTLDFEIDERFPPNSRWTVTGVPVALNIRTGPGTQFEPLGAATRGETVVLTGLVEDIIGGPWVEIIYEEVAGWVFANFLSPSTEDPAATPAPTEDPDGPGPDVAVVTGVDVGLNIRSGPGVGFDVVGGADLGAQLTLTGREQNGWVEVTHAGVTGWVASQYVTPG